MPTLSVIVPATDRPKTLERCVEAIAAAQQPSDELVVIDGPASAGPAEARNSGARRARGDIVVFVDSDVAIHPDALARIRSAFEHEPGLTALFGNYDTRQEGRDPVTAFRNLLFHHVHLGSAGPVATFWAGLGAIRRDRFLSVGGFDADRFPQPAIEDIDLGVRLTQAGGRIVCDPSVMGMHMKDWGVGDMVRTDLWRRGIPWVTLMLRSRSVPLELNLGWRHRLSAAASMGILWSLVRARPQPGLLALGTLLGLNRSFYRLLWRGQGAVAATVGIALHVLHHLVSVAAVPLGVAAYAAERWLPAHRRTRQPAPGP